MKRIIPSETLKRLCFVFLFAVTLVILSPHASAQTGVYASFTAGKTDLPNTDWIYGPTVGAYFDSSHFPIVEWGADIRASFLGGSGKTQMQSGLVGPRLAAHLPVVPLKPYAELLIGAGHVQAGQGSAQISETKFEYQGVFGADVTVFPRIDWRVVEFSYGGLPNLGGGLNPKTISTGLVFRIPFL